MFVGGHLGVSGIRPERADQPSPGQRPGVTGAKRKFPAFCNPLPTLLRQGGERIAERGEMGRPFDPGCRSARGGVALPWAGLICPSGAHRASPIYSWNPCPYHCPGTFTRANDYSSLPPPPPPGTRGFAPGYRPAALQAAWGAPSIRAVGPVYDSPGRNPGRGRPPSTLLFGGLVVCALIHPLAHMAISHMA